MDDDSLDFDEAAKELENKLEVQDNKPEPLYPLITTFPSNLLIELKKAMDAGCELDFPIRDLATKLFMRAVSPISFRFMIDNQGFTHDIPEAGFIVNVIQPESKIMIDEQLRYMTINPHIYLFIRLRSIPVMSLNGVIENQVIPFLSFVYWTEDKEEAYRVAREHDAQVMLDLEFDNAVVPLADPERVARDGGHFVPGGFQLGERK